jgi:hypothetical protein
MDRVTRNVRDLGKDERRIYEAALGEELRDNQQVTIQVAPTESPGIRPSVGRTASDQLPEWCNVYEGLSDADIAEIETVILDRNGWTRDVQ